MALLMRLEARFLRPYRGTFLLGLAGLVTQSLLLLPIPLLQGRILDLLVPVIRAGASGTPIRPQISTFALLWPLAVMLACQLGRTVFSYLVSFMMGRVSQEVVVSMREALHAKLMRLSMTYFAANQSGRLMARVTSDVGSILSFVNSGLLQLANDLILGAGIACVLFWLEWRLALAALLIVPLYAVNHRFFKRKLHRLSQAIRSQVSAIYALLSEKVSAVRLVRSYVQEPAELAILDERIGKHRGLSLENRRTSATLSALATLISGLGTVIVISFGAALVGRGDLTVGSMLAFYGLVGQLYGPIVRLTQFQATALATCVSVERIFEMLDEPEQITDAPNALAIARPQGAVTFRDVSFQYAPDSPMVLDRIDLEVEPGMVVGLVGASGAGKSTLLSLAPRLHDVTAGAVLFDGHDVRGLKRHDLRRAVALVSQHAHLFEGTIRSNLTYANPACDESQIWDALTIADLATTVLGLPQGLDTPVGERGCTLSGGQRQRLALARALLAEPRVLLLDDCTSAVDAETESRILQALEEHLPDRTRIIASHKALAVAQADWIIVLDSGRILEQGTHQSLLAHDGRYAANWFAQKEALGV